jgi:signal transduction histidine kinase
MDASGHRFLQDFTPAAHERLVASLIHQTHPDGTYLFREGDAADGVYLLIDGQIEIIRTAGDHEKILNMLNSGDSFGEVAVIDGFGRSTAARAKGVITIAKIPRAALLDILGTEPGTVALKIFQRILPLLRRSNDMLVDEIVHKEKLSLVGEMASSLMHDLRTPVTSIRLTADLIGTANPSGKIPRWCDGIRLQCDRLVGMAADLMEFSKGESKLAIAPTTTTAFLDQFKNLNEICLNPAGIDVRFEAAPAPVEIDAMRLQRVLQNLVTNAIDALHGIPEPCIEIKAAVEQATFFLLVKDNGPGIPPVIQNRIFEPFVTHGKSKGIGLGMAIVRNIVVAHGGTITFDTAPGKGTTFLVSLPQLDRI